MSYESKVLTEFQDLCQGLNTDLLFPRSEAWMNEYVLLYTFIHKAKLSNAHEIHIHPSQLSSTLVSSILQEGIEIHSWNVNNETSLKKFLIIIFQNLIPMN